MSFPEGGQGREPGTWQMQIPAMNISCTDVGIYGAHAGWQGLPALATGGTLAHSRRDRCETSLVGWTGISSPCARAMKTIPARLWWGFPVGSAMINERVVRGAGDQGPSSKVSGRVNKPLPAPAPFWGRLKSHPSSCSALTSGD